MSLCFSFTSLPKWPFLTFLRNVTSSLRIFKILKYPNILALTVWPIVPITFLILNNHQSGRLAAKNSNSAEIAFFTFWSTVRYSPDSPVNVLIESHYVLNDYSVIEQNLQNARNYFYLRHIDSLQNINGIILHHYSLQILSPICTLRI